MNKRQLIHEEPVEGFTIRFYAHEEDTRHLDAEDIAEIKRMTDAGLQWFVAEVTASKDGIELGTDYMGDRFYKTFVQFVSEKDYSDMKARAINEAKTRLLSAHE